MGITPQSIISSLVGNSIGDAFAKVAGVFKADPTVVAQNAADIEKIKLQLQSQIETAIDNEVSQSAEVIKAEANSQSWLPKNVRPLLLLIWGLTITFNYFLPLIAHFSTRFQTVQPFILPDWIYKLTAIGFTGYVTARTWEKVTNTDN